MYIDAYHDRKKDKVYISERVDKKRVLKELEANYVFYYSHPSGMHKSIFGDSCKKFQTNSYKKFQNKLLELEREKNPPKIFESDLNIVFRTLEDNYSNSETPNLNICFFDIETNFDLDKGFAPVDDPFNYITAITVYNKWADQLITLAVPPPTLTIDEAKKKCIDIENTYLFNEEWDLLDVFLDVIEDADILCGFNSEFYDLPYIINRLDYIGKGKEAHRLSLWGQYPRERKTVKFGKEEQTYDLTGRPHLDMLALYRKHNPTQLHSYKLDYIGKLEVNETKVPYEGTLDDLYKKSFREFILYNRQDVMLLSKIEDKRKFIELSNQVAHANCIQFKTTMGTVALVEQAITVACHSLLNLVMPNRKEKFDEENEEEDKGPVVGAYVANPKKGLHDHVGACDVTSLYPSVIRATSMSIETIFGHIRPIETEALVAQRIKDGIDRAEAWDGIFSTLEHQHIIAQDDTILVADFEDGRVVSKTAKEWYNYIFDPKNNLCITANGTLFKTDQEGIIPYLLSRWFTQRKSLQAQQEEWKIKGKSATTDEDKKECSYWEGFYKQRQQIYKIILNATYGALLNKHCKMYDARIGQSTTLTGRSVIRHISAKINEIICGDYDYRGLNVIAGDTDSCFFSAYRMKDTESYKDFEWSKDNVIELYKQIVDDTNQTLPEFMKDNFNISPEKGKLIKSGLDLVASKSLFIKKKKYACLCYLFDGFRQDNNGSNGYLKAMGIDSRRSDTPKNIQIFLDEILIDVLTEKNQDDIIEKIQHFRTEFAKLKDWEKGSPKRVNALGKFTDKDKSVKNIMEKENKGKALMPGHARASINWNILRKQNHDNYSMPIIDGSKIIVCKLRPNIYKMDSIAYPIDETHLPEWFTELPFDISAMENTLIDQKLLNLVGVLEWDLTKTKKKSTDDIFKF